MGILNNARHFLRDAYNELRKVSWLSRKEVLSSTIVIIIFIFIIALFIGFIDFILSRIVGIVLQR
jgi:preprotein translocase subunit SecE